MDFPAEVWMHIFEALTLDHVSARRAAIQLFLDTAYHNTDRKISAAVAIRTHPAIEETCVKALPILERRAWKTARAFYAINSTSRIAALRLALTTLLLPTCSAPLASFPDVTTNPILPAILTIDLYHFSEFKNEVARKFKPESPIRLDDALRLRPKMAAVVVADMVAHHSTMVFPHFAFSKVKHFQLLAALPMELPLSKNMLEKVEKVVRKGVEKVKRDIVSSGNGVKNEQVEVFSEV